MYIIYMLLALYDYFTFLSVNNGKKDYLLFIWESSRLYNIYFSVRVICNVSYKG